MSGLESGVRIMRWFLADQRGTTAIEYALIAGGIGATVATVIWSVGSSLKTNWYDKIGAAL